jgi:hypothetical protein
MKPAGNTNLERAIESAIIVSWTDLMCGAQTGLIHVEYGFAPTGTLDHLKVLSHHKWENEPLSLFLRDLRGYILRRCLAGRWSIVSSAFARSVENTESAITRAGREVN